MDFECVYVCDGEGGKTDYMTFDTFCTGEYWSRFRTMGKIDQILS